MTTARELLELHDKVQEREQLIASLYFLPSDGKSVAIYCNRTGVLIGTLTLTEHAGKLPYFQSWKETTAYHPFFSFDRHKLVAFTRRHFNNLITLPIDKVTDRQKEYCRVAFMAVLHSLDCIEQEGIALPSFKTVMSHMQRLLELAYWYHTLNSQRFRFPTVRINRKNSNDTLEEIGVYLGDFDRKRESWETTKEAHLEEEKLEAARKAERSVRSKHIRPISKKMLWNWFLSQLSTCKNSSRYTKPEWIKWKEDAERLWLTSDTALLKQEVDDIEVIYDMLLQECELGTLISNAMKEELRRMIDLVIDHATTWEIDWLATNESKVVRVGLDGKRIKSAQEEVTEPPPQGIEPKQGDFSSRGQFLQTHARWQIAGKVRAAWLQQFPATQSLQEQGENQ